MSIYDQGKPYLIDVKAGDKLAFCTCGHTQTPPYCDGSHKAHPPALPLVYKADESTTLYLCGCGKSGKLPFCDGSHENN